MDERTTPFTVSDVLVQSLVAADVDTVYGVVSIHNMPIYDAIARDGRIRAIAARSEGAAVNMADAYARVTGRVGVAITSTGTGAGNAVGALVEAWSAGSSVLHITGEVATPYLATGQGYIHECKNQLGIMENTVKQAYRMRRPAEAAGLVAKAIEGAITVPRGPISIEIPIDVQSAEAVNTPIFAVKRVAQRLDMVQLDEVVGRLLGARRPVLWTGSGAIAAEAGNEVRALAEGMQIPVITTQSGRGILPEDHPLCIGNFANTAAVGELVAGADLLVSVGVRFRSNETAAWRYGVPHAHIGIDADYAAVNRNYENSLGVVGDAKVVLGQIVERVSAGMGGWIPDANYQAQCANVRRTVREDLRASLGPYEQILDAMRASLPKHAVIVRDVTVPSSSWGSRLLEIYEPRTSVHAVGGGIGQGLPMAIGGQLGQPNRTVCLMVGDGGLLVNIGEIATMAQERLPIIMVLFDDAGYGVLRNIQDRQYQRRIGVDLVSPDFVCLGNAFGVHSERIPSVDAFRAAMGRAVRRKEPSMLVVDMNAIGPMRKPFGGPPGV